MCVLHPWLALQLMMSLMTSPKICLGSTVQYNATLQNSYYIQTRTFPPEYSYQFIRSKYIYIMMDGGGDNDDG